MRTFKILSVTLLITLVLVSGCRRGGRSETAGGGSQPSEISAYGITLTKESPPGKVAELLIKGLDNGDTELLKKLVAVKHETAAVDAIYGKYGKKSSITPDKAASLAVAGWKATYSFFKKGETTVTKTDLQGETATINATAKGGTNLEERHIRINLVMEDGWWKVTAGIKE